MSLTQELELQYSTTPSFIIQTEQYIFPSMNVLHWGTLTVKQVPS